MTNKGTLINNRSNERLNTFKTASKTTSLISLSLLGLIALSGCSATGAAIGVGAAAAKTASEERSFNKAITDTQIQIEINDLLFQENISLFRKVNLQVSEGKVLLSGNVELPEHRITAVKQAWKATGVREVINEIEINNDSGITDYARDVWISTQLKTALIFDKRISSINYNIDTVNQSVYLLGIGQDESEINRVIAHAKDIDYVKRVVSYVVLKDNPSRTQ
ncbi:BON domain-containing protein [Kiloniella antarctica]|uniref:BON domain-containing protein n=1 Tax=Kiloniella antarctica TaxID=1550907 RepID=A0ABW5BIZ1_9PROT